MNIYPHRNPYCNKKCGQNADRWQQKPVKETKKGVPEAVPQEPLNR